MKPEETRRPILLFDVVGRPYRFDSEEEIAGRRVDARSYDGFAAARSDAPSEMAGRKPRLMDTEAMGHHFAPRSEFYHTSWEWGNLNFDGQDGLTGSYFCCHAHFSPQDARAYYDPSCDMLPARAGG